MMAHQKYLRVIAFRSSSSKTTFFVIPHDIKFKHEDLRNIFQVVTAELPASRSSLLSFLFPGRQVVTPELPDSRSSLLSFPVPGRHSSASCFQVVTLELPGSRSSLLSFLLPSRHSSVSYFQVVNLSSLVLGRHSQLTGWKSQIKVSMLINLCQLDLVKLPKQPPLNKNLGLSFS
ncbi:hypothetical protein SLEP1_g16574 [Rubroshorea leprosula]|uniref:Uncharacterized protein n=1 Tax=Rubroshorea leprosula TaxID=152421 RepID=A0AAV5J1Y2_9ROSI|nr:hypothetical protein SLEP1_g16574 [Rubroshorea leprosula]